MCKTDPPDKEKEQKYIELSTNMTKETYFISPTISHPALEHQEGQGLMETL